jgi:hypothetical protein
MKFERNKACPCGSGKKYKKCHYGRPFSPERHMTVNMRNRVLIRAAEEIFGFRMGRSWQDFKKNISGEEIRAFYEVQANLWRPDTDWFAVMPPSNSGELRGLYLGDIRPELILRNVVRFSLYSDHIYVVDPFHNPWLIKAEFNPIDNPDQFKADTLKLLYFLFQVAPWIESGIVQLIPDPGDFDYGLKKEAFLAAKERRKGQAPHEKDMEEARIVGQQELQRVLLALPDDALFSQIERSGQKLTDKQKQNFLTYARKTLHGDPLALEQPITRANARQASQLMALRGGANLETALLISAATGAFLYTNMAGRWEEIASAREELNETARLWSPLAKAFQDLSFLFLNNVDVSFANSLREDGRLESFRSLLRKIGKGATDVSGNGSSLEAYVRDCKDELVGEYKKAESEWAKIQEEFIKWAGGGAIAGTTGLMSGHLVPSVASLAAAALNTMHQLWLRHFRRQQFRAANPMSVFIDLVRK